MRAEARVFSAPADVRRTEVCSVLNCKFQCVAWGIRCHGALWYVCRDCLADALDLIIQGLDAQQPLVRPEGARARPADVWYEIVWEDRAIEPRRILCLDEGGLVQSIRERYPTAEIDLYWGSATVDMGKWEPGRTDRQWGKVRVASVWVRPALSSKDPTHSSP